MAANHDAAKPGLVRALRLKELVLYGIILIQPTAPMPLYGVVCQEAKGHVVTTVLVGMIAVLFTAISYGRMARAYPHAGSAYTYVGRELRPSLGYLTGWAMLFDYVMNPIICVIWCSKAAMNFSPTVPYWYWAICFAGLFTSMNLRGIKASARTAAWLAVGLGMVIVLFFVAVGLWLWGAHGLTPASFLRPFYDPETFAWKSVSTGVSIAALTYIGFDAISTLSEEAENPRRNILLATVLTCLITGLLASFQVYAAQLVWPGYNDFPDADTAFVHISGKVGGPILFMLVNLALLVATVGSGSGAHLAAGRLLYGMGRDNAIPKRFFGMIDPRYHVPRNNILLVGGVALAGAFAMSYQLGAELLNFGAFLGFMGVNVSAFVRYYVRAERRTAANFLPPILGFLVCFYIWLSLRPVAQLVGLGWLSLGFIYGGWKTKGYRETIEFKNPDEEV
jgi:amino acid transporter